MFKIGDKAKGFKFDGDKYDISYSEDMNRWIGEIGEVYSIESDYFVVNFEGEYWSYPKELSHLAKIEETTSFNVGEDVSFKVGDKVIPSFQIGDRVKFKKSSIDSGMIDAAEDDAFEVTAVFTEGLQILREGWLESYAFSHFEHVKEEVMNNTEEQEIKWEIGQDVWCIIFGKGVVIEVGTGDTNYPIRVDFENDTIHYTTDGKCYYDHHRTLFFSEPKIEAEKFPPKKPFVPVFKKGDVVVVKWVDTTQVLILEEETERQVKGTCGQVWDKDPDVHFYKLGEEIIFD